MENAAEQFRTDNSLLIRTMGVKGLFNDSKTDVDKEWDTLMGDWSNEEVLLSPPQSAPASNNEFSTPKASEPGIAVEVPVFAPPKTMVPSALAVTTVEKKVSGRKGKKDRKSPPMASGKSAQHASPEKKKKGEKRRESKVVDKKKKKSTARPWLIPTMVLFGALVVVALAFIAASSNAK